MWYFHWSWERIESISTVVVVVVVAAAAVDAVVVVVSEMTDVD